MKTRDGFEILSVYVFGQRPTVPVKEDGYPTQYQSGQDLGRAFYWVMGFKADCFSL